MTLFQDDPAGSHIKIFASEHLDRKTLSIYLYARKLKKKNLISYYGIRNGMVYIRKTDKDDLIDIQSSTDLDGIECVAKD